MARRRSRKIFVNLPVRDLRRSMEFFTRLGFEFDPQFTDDNAACLVIGEEAFAMLLAEPFFRTFTKRDVCDTARCSEALLALSCESRGEVDQLVARAVAAGASHAMEPVDHGFMYAWSFYDLDGHHWEVVWMEPAALAAQGARVTGGRSGAGPRAGGPHRSLPRARAAADRVPGPAPGESP